MESRTFGPLKLILIAPQDLQLEVDLLDRGATRPETGQQVMDRLRPDALVCGPMFEIVGSQNPSGTSYAQYTVAKLIYRYLDTKNNILVNSSYPARGGTLSVAGNRAEFKNGDAIQNGATFAIQGYPTLIENSRNTASSVRDTQAEGRCALGLMADGAVAFAQATLGMYAFANAMISAGVQWAVYLDGGGSTTLAGAGFHVGLQARRLPAYIMAKSSTSGIIHDGMNDIVKAVTSPVTIVKTLLPVVALGAAFWYILNEE